MSIKKLMLACTAIAAFAAFVVAPAASASPVLTDGVNSTTCCALAPGASIKATNTGITTFTASNLSVECTHAELRGTVTANTGTTIAGEIPLNAYTFSGTGTNGDCTGGALGSVKPTINSRICIDTIKGSDSVSIDGCNNAKGETKEPIVFTLDSTLGVNCKYSVPTITGTFLTSKDATVNLEKAGPAALIEGGFLCPPEGTLDMDFDLTTTDGSTIYVS